MKFASDDRSYKPGAGRINQETIIVHHIKTVQILNQNSSWLLNIVYVAVPEWKRYIWYLNTKYHLQTILQHSIKVDWIVSGTVDTECSCFYAALSWWGEVVQA